MKKFEMSFDKKSALMEIITKMNNGKVILIDTNKELESHAKKLNLNYLKVNKIDVLDLNNLDNDNISIIGF